MRSDFEQIMNENGVVCTFTKHTIAYSGLYGEALFSGTNTTNSGLAMFEPIGPQDMQFLPQGQVSLFPRRMFVHGSIDLQADSVVIDSTGSAYQIIPGRGVVDWVESGTIIYREAFVRAQIGSEFEYVGE